MAAGTDITQEIEVLCELGSQVDRDFQRAKNARSSVDAELLNCLRQRKGEYGPEEAAANMGSIKTFVNATSTKCRAGEAWISDIMSSIKGDPWTITPTPIPSVSQQARQAVVDRIKAEVIKLAVPEESIDAYIRDRAEDLKAITLKYLEDEAKNRCVGMSRRIADIMTEAGLLNVLAEVRYDIITMPYGVLKGPVIRNKKRLKWLPQSNIPEVTVESVMAVERVSPFEFYWAPWATNPNQGYVIHVMNMESKAIHDCMGLPGFDSDKIKTALNKYVDGYKADPSGRSQRYTAENVSAVMTGDTTIDVLDYWGPIQGQDLLDWGYTDTIEAENTYEVNLWTVGDVCIRAVLNPDPLGLRPFYVTSYEKIPGSMTGKGVPQLMRSHQEIINSASRALRRNMGLASGPFVEVDAGRLAAGQAPEELAPMMVKLVSEDMSGGGHSAYRFHHINSHAAELVSVMKAESVAIDDATGIPAYTHGNTGQSGVGRTVGGLAMLMGNAAKGIKMVVGHIERDMIEPLIIAAYNYEMLYGEDESIKADAQIVARGPTGVIMRDALIQRQLEALQIITPYAPAIPALKDGIPFMLREVLKGLDLPVDKIIPDPEKQEQLQNIASNIQGGQAPSSMPQNNIQPEQLNGSTVQPSGRGVAPMQPGKPGVGTIATPVLDGRSGPTVQALAAMNNV